MGARADRATATSYSRAGGHRRSRAGPLRRVVRDVPALVHAGSVAKRHVPRGGGAASRHRGDGLRRRLSAADPSDRPHAPQGPEQLADAGAGRSRQPVGDRLRGGRPHGDRARARHARRFRSLRRPPRTLGLEVALDIAFQSSPDHPWVHEHPEWFQHRPDGSIKYAENPPKKYQDIYPLDFWCGDWRALWDALRDVFLFWIEHGVHDLPRRQPAHEAVPFWEWCIAEIKREHPDAIFLSEAFTRPKVMRYLAKAGFTQSYTYFTWRNTAQRAARVPHRADDAPRCASTCGRTSSPTRPTSCTSICSTAGGRRSRCGLMLAATLAARYGIYSGFELCENVAGAAGIEEYLDSEKYQIKPRDWNQPGNSERADRARQRDPPRASGAPAERHARVPRRRQPDAFLWFSKSAASAKARRSNATAMSCSSSSTPTRHQMQHGWVEVPIWRARHSPEAPLRRRGSARRRDATRGAARGTTCGSIRRERMAHIFVVRDATATS